MTWADSTGSWPTPAQPNRDIGRKRSGRIAAPTQGSRARGAVARPRAAADNLLNHRVILLND